MINLHIRSENLETPIIRLFRSTMDDCTTLDIIPIDEIYQQKNYCVIGVDGKAEVIAKLLDAGNYYIAISTLDSGPGPFTLCVNGLMEATPCITISPIVVASRSFDGPLSGPFFQGEILSMYAEVLNQSNLSMSCDFFQGLVPILGTSWDEQFSDPYTSPLDAKINNQMFNEPLNGLYSGTWSWYPNDVNYHAFNENIKLDFFTDALTFPALKHALYEPEIVSSNFGLESACCDPCWDLGGSILPPGWFCEGNLGRCNLDGKVRYKYGDGLTNCAPFQGPWTFTFSLPISKHIPSCNTDGDLELYLSLFPFTDGVIGSWFQDFKCVNDPYAFKRLPLVCNDIQGEPIPLEFVNHFACPGDSIIIQLDSLVPSSTEVAFWSYEFEEPNMQFPSSGFLLPGDSIVFTENPGGAQGQSFSGWLQAYHSARELLGRFYFGIQFLILPEASFTWQIIDNKVKFIGPIGDHVSYHWDFGDGDTSILRSPQHLYLQEGKYVVQLIMSNACGSDTLEQEIYFIYQFPDASFIIPDSVICRHDSITFSHTFSGIIDSLTWHFQGGQPDNSHDSLVTVKYPDIGLFDVELTIYNPLGSDTQVKEQAVEVKEEVDLTYSVWVQDSLIYLIYLGDADVVKWKIGDLFSWIGDSVHYIFLDPGIYPVTLYAENVRGQDSLQFNVEILSTALDQMIDEEDFLLYPNPTKESIYVYPPRDFHSTQIWLQDMSGQTLCYKNVHEEDSLPFFLDLKSFDLPTGMYVLTIANHDRFIRKKVVFIP